MDANKLALDILAFLNENLVLISHNETRKTWSRAFKRIIPLLEEKSVTDKIVAKKFSEGPSHFAILDTKKRYHDIEIAQMRIERIIRDEYSFILSQHNKKLLAIITKIHSNKSKDHDEKLIQIIKIDNARRYLLRKDLYSFISLIKRFTFST